MLILWGRPSACAGLSAPLVGAEGGL